MMTLEIWNTYEASDGMTSFSSETIGGMKILSYQRANSRKILTFRPQPAQQYTQSLSYLLKFTDPWIMFLRIVTKFFQSPTMFDRIVRKCSNTIIRLIKRIKYESKQSNFIFSND